MEIVINYDPIKKEYNIYESSTQTVLNSTNLTEGLVGLDLFLKSSGLVDPNGNILDRTDINYHIDSATMKSMVESNVNILKRLRNGPSEFKTASDKFGGPGQGSGQLDFSRSGKNFVGNKFGGTSKSFKK